MAQLHYRTCNLCETMCGIEIEHDGEQVLAIRGDKNDVLSQGNICPKATGLQDIHTDPDRLRKPLKRIRKSPATKSPDDEWVEVEWEEAFDYVAHQLANIQREFGMDAIGSYCSGCGTGRSFQWSRDGMPIGGATGILYDIPTGGMPGASGYSVGIEGAFEQAAHQILTC